MDVTQAALQPKAPTSATRAAAAPAQATAKATEAVKSDPGPAAKVDISSEGRARLRAAGAATSDIARVNLKDVHAVDRAVQKARAQRVSTGHHDAAPAKTK
jgi:hypothetical protein